MFGFFGNTTAPAPAPPPPPPKAENNILVYILLFWIIVKMIEKHSNNSFGKIIVTPGIRPMGSQNFDQKRICDPVTAINNGADYLVIGRPITEAINPLIEVNKITAQLIGNLSG